MSAIHTIRFLLVLLLGLSLLAHSVTAQICDRTDTIEDLLLTALNNADCNDVNATDLNTLSGTLNWSNQEISQITDTDLADLIGIADFDLSSNKLIALVNDSFIDTNPVTISLANNNITNIASDALSTSTSPFNDVAYDLSNNAITSATLASGFLNTLSSTHFFNKSFDLSYNNITSLERSSLKIFTTNLNLSYNQIDSIPSDAFFDLRRANAYMTLDLSHNALTSLESEVFFGETFATVDLSYNQIDTLATDATRFAERLTWLNLGYNQIVDFNASAINQNAGKYNIVMDLVLDGNPLVFKANNFAGLSLDNLYLRDLTTNTIASMTFAGISEIDSIHLSNGNIAVLQSAAFLGTSAINIDVSNNQITSLPINLFNQHNDPSTISSFNISGNQLPNNSWEITDASWKEDINGDYTLQIGHSLPVDINLNLNSVTGTLSPSAISIAAGSTSSQAVTWTPTNTGDPANFTVDKAQINVSQLSGYINIPNYELNGVCGRTTPFPALLSVALSDEGCESISVSDLHTITATQDWSNKNISTIITTDLAGLFNVTNINFANNNIATLYAGTFAEVTAHTLDFSNNNISVIDRDALNYFGTPGTLNWNFSNNSISSATLATGFLLDKTTVGNGTPFSKFNLSYNQITEIQKAYISNLRADNLDLSHNQIINFPADTFNGLHLDASAASITINLNNNNITALETNTFDGDFWDDIYLANNQISSLAQNAFLNVKDLLQLDLSYNQIVDFNASSVDQSNDFPSEMNLFLDGNPLILKPSNFAGLKVRFLYLQELPTSTIPAYTFTGIDSLDSVRMGNGNISILQENAFANAGSLTRLELFNNKLESIPSGLFGTGSNINRLYLQDNQIASIGTSAFAQLGSLVTLDLSDNDLTTLQSGDFLGMRATNIDVSGNKIASLPINLFNQHNDPSTITSFDITGNSLANNTWEITQANWIEDLDGDYTLQIGHSLPVDINLNLTSASGTLSPNSITISAGSTSSQEFAWTPTNAGDPANFTVNLDQVNVSQLSGYINIPSYEPNGVCDRTTPFPALLSAALSDQGCASITVTDLNTITATQDWSSQSINNIINTDLAGLFSITNINFANNNITTLVDGTFEEVTAHTLDFSNNNISVIEQDALAYFGDAPFKLDWNFSNNSISSDTLASGFLVGKSRGGELAISEFNLSYNNITAIQQSYFDGINIKILDLSHNQIVTFPSNTFDTIYLQQDGPNIILHLNHNNITALATNSFFGLAWEAIYLANNQISSLALNTFNTVSDLLTLDLSYNQIVDFNASSVHQGSGFVALNSLFFDNNPLILKPSNFSGLSIRNLYLRELPTSTIPSNTFASINLLDTIYMSNGNISELQTDAFTNAAGLDNLYLDNNSLTNIPGDAFGSGSSLNNLYLQDNQIATIGTGAFAQLTELNQLNLSGNALSTLQSGDFLGMRATNIDVSDNQIASLPINLFNQHNDPSTITSFNITGNSLANNTWEITQANWLEDLNGNFTLQLGHSLPVDINLNLTSASGTLSPNSITISAGSTSSQEFAWTPTNAGDPANFTVNLDQVNVSQLSGYINIPSYEPNGVCDRTTPFPALLSAALSDQGCASITVTDLNTINATQDWSNQSISAISSADLDGLTQVQNINFANNNITTLVDGTFLQTAVKNHNFSNNNISIIERDALDHSALYHFDAVWNFSNNAITSDTLASGFMLGHAHPTELEINDYNFSYNNITAINQAYFYKINVDTLDLSHNQIVNFPANTFDTLYPKLDGPSIKLYLNDNDITALASNSFNGPAWESVYFANNQISSLGTNTFNNFGDLVTLDLSYNQIVDFNASSVDQGVDNPAPIDFYLDGNPLILKPSNFSGLRVRNLYLRELPTSTIPSNTFASINLLDTIYMSNGNISELQTDAFTNAAGLDNLYLDNNSLTNIPGDAFGSGSSLKNLYLQDNQIASIGTSAFAQLTELNLLNLSSNSLTSLTSVQLDGLAATNIDLSDNSIATLPLDLLATHTRPGSITNFDLTGNPAANNQWEITTAQWQENLNGSFQLQLGHSLPTAINVTISSDTGTLSNSSLIIPAGSTSSQPIVWTQTVADSVASIQLTEDQINDTVLNGFITLPDLIFNGVCDRTTPFPTLLATAVGDTNCNMVMAGDLDNLTAAQDWTNQSIVTIAETDLTGLINVETFDFSNNNLTKLVDGTFLQTSGKNLDFSNNNISIIETDALDHSANSHYNAIWNFSNNSITSGTLATGFLLGHALITQNEVNNYNFSYNNITAINQAYFHQINVARLDLSHNQIINFPANTFDTIFQFSGNADIDLDLSNNNITALATRTFSSAAWKNIYLANNQISSLGAVAFDTVYDLRTLDLAHNQISDFNATAINKPGLQSPAFDLFLDGNPLILKPSNFSGLRLRDLYLRELQTSTIPGNTFTGTEQLGTIHLSNGNISELQTDAFTNAAGLDNLYLDNNSLTNIPSDAFGSGSSLQKLYLQDNQIASIGTGAFAKLTTLNLLDLSGNNLTALHSGSFNGLTATDIDLSDSDLATLPLDLLVTHTRPESITKFDLTGNAVATNSWEITTAQWQQNTDNSFTLQIGHAIPTAISVTISSVNGTLSQSNLTIAAGSTSSQAVTWTQTVAGSLPDIQATEDQINDTVLGGFITLPDFIFNGVCDRTTPFPDLLTAAVGDTNCNMVMAGDLDNLTAAQDWSNESISTINATDLAGLFNIDTFDFSNNNLTKLVNGTFLHTSGKKLDFSNNNISIIERDSLVHSATYHYDAVWNFSNNSITSDTLATGFMVVVPDNQDQEINNYNFSYNNITTIQPAYFDQINVERLDLSHNQIVNFPANTFDTIYFRNDGPSTYLYLNHNNITALQANSFSEAAWQDIYLANNQISSLGTNAFNEVSDLKVLDLSYNKIIDFNSSAVTQGSHASTVLSSFFLDANPLILKTSNFSGLSIRNLYLRELPTSTIPSNTFASINNLDTIYMSNGNISELQTDAFTIAAGLNNLYLDNNSLTNIPSDAFGSGSNLTNLYLQDNQIATIGSSAFAELTVLATLDLSGNDLTALHSGSFNGLTATDIDLSNSQFSTLPVNLLAQHTQPESITNFNVSGNELANGSWEISKASWVAGANNSYSLELAHALPEAVSINVSSNTGSLSVLTLTIAKGNTSSQAVTWTSDGSDSSASIVPAASQHAISTLSGYITLPSVGYSDICQHTSQIQTLILTASNKTNCVDVTESDLAAITAISFNNIGLATLSDFDLDYLANISSFDFSDNNLNTVVGSTFDLTDPASISFAHNNINVIEQSALLTMSSPDNNVDYNLSNNAITSTTLSSGFLNGLKSETFPNKSIDLSFNNITTLDNSQLDIRSDNLNLSHNQITNLPATVFVNTRQSFHDMVIDLSYNQLTSIAADTFFGETVAQVDLSYNQIDALATNFVSFGEDLTSLDLGYNLISDFNASSIDQNSVNLNVQLDLTLDGNPLVLKANNFAGLELDYVYIRNSNLTTIPADTFATATNINRIFLTGTNLTALEAGSFSSAPGLDFLYLNNNQITTIPVDAFGTISTLRNIYLGDNNLTAVPENTFSNLMNLQTLSLDGNQLTAVPVNMLGNNGSLTTFRLQENNIANLSGISFSEYTSLSELNLRDNAITQLNAANFANMTATKIYFAGNQISTLPLNLLAGHADPSSITSFEVSNNLLENDSWEITNVSWVEGATGGFTLQLGHALPMDISINITSVTGDLNETQVTITQGSTSSNLVSWTADGSGLDVSILPAVSDLEIVQLGGYINLPTQGYMDLCDRTAQIQTLILNALAITSCADVTLLDLLGLTTSDIVFSNQNINTLSGIDLDYLTNLTVIDLSANNLSTVVNSTFDLTDPASISLAHNNISVIEQGALLTSSSPDNNVDYNLSNNAITSTTLNSGFLNGLKSQHFPNKSIDLSYNNITTLERTSFDIFTTNLNLSNNQIVDFAVDALYDLRLAGIDMVLDLSYNQLSNIAARSLFGEALGQVDLSYNQIHTLAPEAVFSGVDLTSLDLGYNLISDFNASSINQTNNPNVQLDLVLDGNPIVLKANNFAGLELDEVYIRNSSLTTIPADAFADATNINRIYLSGSNITTLESGSFSSVAGLDFLFLNNNQISNISVDAFGATSTLTHIYLGVNNLTTVPENTFSNLTNIQRLNLDNNQLTAVPVNILGNNGSLTHFRLQDNNIANLSGISFSEYTSLAELNLADNAITDLNAANFANMTATRIYFAGNQISSLPLNLLAGHTDPATISSFDVANNLLDNDSWEITNVSWVEGSSGEFTLQLGHALPINITVPLSSSNGDLNVTQITITKGQTSSNSVSWTASDAVTTQAHILPALTTYQVPALSGHLALEEYGSVGICSRTQAIIDILLVAVSGTNCVNVAPNQLSALTGSLDISNQNITTLQTSDLAYLSNVTLFNLDNNNIDTLLDYTFSTTASTTISLSNNNLSAIQVNALHTSINGDDDVSVNLSSNAITAATLSSGFLTASATHTFVGGSFDLSDNQITTLAAASFADFNPAQLYLHDNALTSIEDNALAAATGLKTLNLANNQLNTIAESTLSGLSSLITLDLSNNALANMSGNALLDLSSLVTLNLTNNQLSTITAATFNGLAATAIDLSNNNIASLPIDLLINHTNPAAITTFDLSGNTVDNWQITQANWLKLDGDDAQLTLPHTLPMDVTVALSSTTGTLNPSTVTILAGELNSSTVTWTGDAGNALEIIPVQTQFNIPVLSGFVSINSIADAPSFVAAVDTQTVVQDHTFTPITLPTATGGDGDLTYTLVETNNTELPTGLLFNASTRMLSGSIATAGNYSLTYSVQDTEADSASMLFTLAVQPNLQPTFPSSEAIIYPAVEDELVTISLPAASAGNGEIVYSLDQLSDLPAGLIFNATERSITGSTNATGTYTFTYAATDSLDDDSSSLNISIMVETQLAPIFDATELFDNMTMRQDVAQFQLELPSASGGNGDLSYSFTTDGTAGLPAGLVFNTTSLMIEGQPTEFGEFNITVTLDDADLTAGNDSDSFNFTLIILESLGFATDLEETYSVVSGAPFAVTLPAGQGGVPAYTYALNGTLPAGLSFDATNRQLSGTSNSDGDYNLTYIVTDDDGFSHSQQTTLVVSLLAPEFLASINDIEIQLGQSINVTLPAVTTDGQIGITYSISGAPAGILFNAATRQLTGGATELGTHTITYKAIDTAQQQVEQSFDITVTTNTAVLQDIMWRQALAIADQTVNSVKKRFALVNQHRLPYVENANGIGANFQVTETNWLGLWLNSGSGSLANQDSSYSWDGSTGVIQIGVDFSGKDYLVGLTSETVSTSSSFTVTGDAFDYTGNLDVSGLGLLSFYGGYYQPKYSVWAITSSGSGSADLSITAEGSSSTLSSGVDYSMFAFGGSYKIDDIFDVGFEGITSAALDFSDNTISSVSSNSASRNKFFGSIDFGKWTNKSAKPAAKKTRSRTRTSKSSSVMSKFSWSPKLALALRSDSGEGSSSSGLETTASVQVEYSMLNFEFGLRNFASGDFSESGQWLSFNLIPTGKTGLNFTHRQQFGNSGSAENALLSDAALTDIVAGMRQDDTVTSISTIAYGWNIKAGSLQLYSKGESSYADSTAASILDTKSDIRWEHIGLSFDSASSKYSWNADITGGFMDQYINANNSTSGLVAEDPTTISFKAKIRF